MGKKGVLLDNGKTAQSSMALYWKCNKERSKMPKEKKQKELTMEQDLDIRAVSGFQKWKLHKQKMITKAYKKIEDKANLNKNDQKYQQEQVEQQYQVKQKKKEDMVIPGYGSKQKLLKKLQIQKLQQVDQSKNVLIIPPQFGYLKQENILEILRAKKNKQQKFKQNKPRKQEQDIILGEQLYQPKKIEEVKQKQLQTIKKSEEQLIVKKIQEKQQPFFKSQILNNISKGEKLINIIQKNTQHQKQQIRQQKEIQQLNVIHTGFIPRALRK